LDLDDPLVPPPLQFSDRIGFVPRQQDAEVPEQRAAATAFVDQSQVGHAAMSAERTSM
jgi:hypothetical protein